MLRKIFKPRRGAASFPATISAGRRVYAIGDVHGCNDLLGRLLALIEDDDRQRGPARTTTIFLGDLVDRGPDSAGVIDRLLRLAESGRDVRFLAGNHEEIFLGAVEGEPKALRLFSRIGGRETTISYGVDPSAYDLMDYDDLAKALADAVPQAHIDFVTGFEDLIEIGEYVFVHAGVRPDVPLDQQRRRDLRWIRDPFLDYPRALPRMIVHGHTISDDLDVQAHRIGIDTGAYETGRLTALGLEGADRWTLEAL